MQQTFESFANTEWMCVSDAVSRDSVVVVVQWETLLHSKKGLGSNPPAGCMELFVWSLCALWFQDMHGSG